MKLARSLHRQKVRYRERAMLVEGVRPLREALDTGAEIHVVLLSTAVEADSHVGMLAREFARDGYRVARVDEAVFYSVSDTETPQGIAAVAVIPELQFPASQTSSPFILIIDQVRDPGNVGTLIRSAHGAGADAVLIPPGSADPFSPKVVRAAMGSHFHVPVQRMNWDSPASLLSECSIFAAAIDATTPYDAVDWRGPSSLIVGNETQGLSEDAKTLSNQRVGIPLARGLESLNAAVAGSIIMFEAARQRRKEKGRIQS